MLSRPHSSPCAPFLNVLAAIALSSTATAQTAGSSLSVDPQSGGALQEVVVSAQRKSERLADVPISVIALSPQQLEASGIASTQDLPILTPGLVFGQQAGYAQPYLRGVGTVASGPGVENPVALYVDGVYYGAAAGGVLSLASIDRVEVDKGPQGTLFGRNATGGLIQITTKDPEAAFGGVASATYGNYATTGTDLYVTGGVISDVASNLSLHFSHQGDGYGRNLYNGAEVSKTQEIAARNKWVWAPAEDTSVKLTLDYEQSQFIPNYGPAPGTTALGAPPYSVPPQDIAGIVQPFGNIHEGGASFDVKHDFDIGQFASISAYRQSTIDVDGAASLSIDPAYSLSSVANEHHLQITQEFGLSAPKSERIQWTAGAFLYDSHAQFWPPVQTTGGLIAPLTYLQTYSNQRDYSAALYGQATTQILPATNMTLGFRYTVERRDFDGNSVYGFTEGSQVAADSRHQIFDKPTWRFSLDHHFSEDVMAYVSYNRGFKAGGFNDAVIPAVSYAPETLDAYELGSKVTLFERHLSLNSTAFLYNYRNIQEVVYTENGQFLIYNGAEARSYGLDVDAQLKPVNDLTLTVGLEAIHDRFSKFPNAAISTPMEGGGTMYTVGSATGNRIPLTPDYTSTFTAEYRIRLARAGTLSPGVTYAYNSGFYGEPDNRLHQADYNVVNAQLAWVSPAELWTLRLWGKNLNNAQYVTSLGSQPNGDFAVFSPPRTYGVTVSRTF